MKAQIDQTGDDLSVVNQKMTAPAEAQLDHRRCKCCGRPRVPQQSKPIVATLVSGVAIVVTATAAAAVVTVAAVVVVVAVTAVLAVRATFDAAVARASSAPALLLVQKPSTRTSLNAFALPVLRVLCRTPHPILAEFARWRSASRIARAPCRVFVVHRWASAAC
jgi:hypothetical protein